ncbi:lymphocyte antigen 6G-like [Simochromis diagramma]|uniref:lymphocyte antigen 6G-like n=1 Tax=Simochromis diagramma TaxID=43689 RepID=UPI001A7E9A05|nr:lymphocyte antigen 6G-like [Simochromis diagramma]
MQILRLSEQNSESFTKKERLSHSFFPCKTDYQTEFMMQLYRALILCVTLSAVCGLRCYTCTAADPKSCIDSKSCAVIFNRCFSLRVDGYNLVTKGCQTSAICGGAMACCEGDLCNSTAPTGPSALLLLVSSAILKFLF